MSYSNYKLNEDERWREQQRLLFATTIIAAAIGYLAFFGDKSTQTDLFTQLIRIGLYGAGAIAFLFLLTTAINLKYRNPGYTGHISLPVTHKIRQILYDSSVDVFEYSVIIIVSGKLSKFIGSILNFSEAKISILGFVILLVIFGIGNFVLEPRMKKAQKSKLNSQ